jgi:lipoyl(octanoyl) transferase
MANSGNEKISCGLLAQKSYYFGMRPETTIHDLGLIDYMPAYEEQLRLHGKRVHDEIPDTLMLLEHPHIFTLGRHATGDNIVWNEEMRKQFEVDVLRVDRGGDVTYHGPGQLVGYPIVKLQDHKLQPRGMVERVENLIIRTVAAFGIHSYVHPEYPGVWVNDAKICAIGMRIKEGVSYHGFALNVSTDLSYFSGIVPCGIQDKSVCSLSSVLGRRIDINTVKSIIAKEALSTL